MTILATVLGVSLTLSLGSFLADIGAVSAHRARAQLAADSAALAAAAESAPYGAGVHEAVARSYATSNGAHLIDCRCPPGAHAVEVKVAVDGVTAAARAVIEPEAFQPASLAFDAHGLNPDLARAARTLVQAARGRVWIVSGYRSPSHQAELWSAALRRYGSPERADDWVAPPGHSMHERGLAVDLGGDLALAVAVIRRLDLPLYRPLPNEPWHFELVGSRG